jgi:zinc protease
MRSSALLIAVFLAGCAPAAAPVAPMKNLAIPVRDPAPRPADDDDAREAPPEPEPDRPLALPSVLRDRLASGGDLLVAQQKSGSPRVEVRLVLRGAGAASDGAHPGLALLALRLCFEGGAGRLAGRDLLDRIEATGAQLTFAATPDAAQIALSVPRDRLGDALDLALLALREPRLDGADLARVKKLARSAQQNKLRGGVDWLGQLALTRELFRGSALAYPYAQGEPLPADLDPITAADLKAFHKARYTPAALAAVVVGDIEAPDARAALDRAAGAWKGTETAPPALPSLPEPPGKLRVVLVDLPGATTARLLVGGLGPERGAEGWVAAALWSDLLGGSPTARAPAALREAHPLAAAARAQQGELGRGPTLAFVRATAEVDKAGQALATLLDEAKKLADAPATDAEVAASRRRLLSVIGQSVASPPALADLLAAQAALRLPDDALARSLDRARAVDAAAAQKQARTLIDQGLVVVAVGDAARLAPQLSRLGEVTQLDPARNLEKVRVIPATTP